MSRDFTNRNPLQQPALQTEALDRLTDELSEDVLATSSERLMSEAAEDHGDRLVFARAFDQAFQFATGHSSNQKIAKRVHARVARAFRVPSVRISPVVRLRRMWKPVAAVAASIAVVVTASGFYLRQQQPAIVQAVASQTTSESRLSSPERLYSMKRDERLTSAQDLDAAKQVYQQALGQAQTGEPSVNLFDRLPEQRWQRLANAAAAAATPEAPLSVGVDTPVDAKRVRTTTVRGDLAARRAPPAPGPSAPSPAAALAPAQSATVAAAALPPAKPAEIPFVGAPDQPNNRPVAPKAVADEINNFGTLSFVAPVRGPIIMGFGRTDNGRQNEGIDYAVPEGTDIHAAEDGVVIYAGDDSKGYGNLLLVRHVNGFVTSYAHASELLVKTGDSVVRGQIIAKAGRTGNIPTPRLHFEIRKETVPVDPMRYLSPG
jgi:murein DD-endopeptidase MepM/ murein hydrolase activator NlpD